MARFASPERTPRWAAPSPGNHGSAGKHEAGSARYGNSAIRYILCECVSDVLMTKSNQAAKIRSCMARKSYEMAIVAVAEKTVRLICIRLSGRRRYLDQAIDCAAMSAR